MPGGRIVQLAMSLGTALLGVLLLLLAGSSELGLFGSLFVVLGALGVVLWFVLPTGARR
jgi:hypothetical protein